MARRNIPAMAAIDTEHQLQVGLVRAFEEALRKDDLPSARSILDQMAELANTHFTAEELLMRVHHYPRFEEHVQQHAHLLEELDSVKRAWSAGRLVPTLELAERLRRSLADHLQGPDHSLAAHLMREAISAEEPHLRI